MSNQPIGNAALVAPAKAGIHWKCLDAGWRRDDGQVSKPPIGNAALVAPAKAQVHWNPWMPAGGGMTGKCQTIGLETLPAPGAGLPGGWGWWYKGGARMRRC